MDIDKLKQEITKEVMYATESVLNYASIAIEPNRYPQFRARILSLGNDSWRNIHEWIEKAIEREKSNDYREPRSTTNRK